MNTINLYNADCFDILPTLKENSVDMVLCDLPYGTTQNPWDIILPWEKLWTQYNRVVKDNGAIVLFAQGLFYVDLVSSNKKLFKYDLVWDKVLTSGFLNANRMPLRQHEQIAVFYKDAPTYNPQKVKGNPNHSKGKPKKGTNNNYGDFEWVDNKDLLGDMKHPTSIISCQKPHPSVAVHPTQKPIELLENLIKTYTNEGETVLDNCMGSGSTVLAAMNTNRKVIGIELNNEYYKIAEQRVAENTNRLRVEKMKRRLF